MNLQTDETHCGSCTKVCTNTQSCVGGTCVNSCNPALNLALSATATSSGGGSSTSGAYDMNDGYDESQCATQGWHWVSAGSTPGLRIRRSSSTRRLPSPQIPRRSSADGGRD